MLRVLLPSWRFFDDSAGSPRLLLRTAAFDADFGPWRALAFAPRSAQGSSSGPDTSPGSPSARPVDSRFARTSEGALSRLARAPEGALSRFARAPEGALARFTRAPQGALRLLFHPLSGLRLAHYSLVEHLLDELAELDPSVAADVTALVSYRLVLRLVERELASADERELASSVAIERRLRFQFKVTLFDESADVAAGLRGSLARHDASFDGGEDLLVSSIHLSPTARFPP